MKFVLLFSLISTVSWAKEVPHFDLEMTSSEYRAHLQTLRKNKNFKIQEPILETTIKLGERLADWIKTENANRDQSSQIRLTAAHLRRGIPIDQARVTSIKSIQAKYDEIMGTIPEVMKDVLTSTRTFPEKLPLTDELFIEWGRKVDSLYQSAARYTSLIEWRDWYAENKSRDVRGYYFLKLNNWTATRLESPGEIDPETEKNLKEWLTGICINAEGLKTNCAQKVSASFGKKGMGALFIRWNNKAKNVWESFFKVPTNEILPRVEWTKNNMKVPFIKPEEVKFQKYLKENVEAEFKWQDWSMMVKFVGKAQPDPYLIFEKGVVPHVTTDDNGVPHIVMDENQPIEEYESQWTIRHEFGHIVGLPDCYHEFWDTEKEAFINYQLDIKDLMCSRAGDMNERIYLELKRSYGK